MNLQTWENAGKSEEVPVEVALELHGVRFMLLIVNPLLDKASASGRADEKEPGDRVR